MYVCHPGHRAGNGAHGMMGLGVDGWSTWGIRNNDTALLEYYGASDITGEDRTNLFECEWLCAQTVIGIAPVHRWR